MRSRYEKGKQAEDLAAEFLLKRGVKVVARNFRCVLGEIDLIGIHRGAIVFVEVKSRLGKAHGSPQEAVSRDKQRRLTRLAQWYIKQNRLENHSARFDVIAVTWQEGEPNITWIANAFEARE